MHANSADQVSRLFLELGYADLGQVVKDNPTLFIALHAPTVSLPVSPYILL